MGVGPEIGASAQVEDFGRFMTVRLRAVSARRVGAVSAIQSNAASHDRAIKDKLLVADCILVPANSGGSSSLRRFADSTGVDVASRDNPGIDTTNVGVNRDIAVNKDDVLRKLINVSIVLRRIDDVACDIEVPANSNDPGQGRTRIDIIDSGVGMVLKVAIETSAEGLAGRDAGPTDRAAGIGDSERGVRREFFTGRAATKHIAGSEDVGAAANNC